MPSRIAEHHILHLGNESWTIEHREGRDTVNLLKPGLFLFMIVINSCRRNLGLFRREDLGTHETSWSYSAPMIGLRSTTGTKCVVTEDSKRVT